MHGRNVRLNLIGLVDLVSLPGDMATVTCMVRSGMAVNTLHMSHYTEDHCIVLIPVNHKTMRAVITQPPLPKLFPHYG